MKTGAGVGASVTRVVLTKEDENGVVEVLEFTPQGERLIYDRRNKCGNLSDRQQSDGGK